MYITADRINAYFTEPSWWCGRAILSSTNRIMRECVKCPVYFNNSKSVRKATG